MFEELKLESALRNMSKSMSKDFRNEVRDDIKNIHLFDEVGKAGFLAIHSTEKYGAQYTLFFHNVFVFLLKCYHFQKEEKNHTIQSANCRNAF